MVSPYIYFTPVIERPISNEDCYEVGQCWKESISSCVNSVASAIFGDCMPMNAIAQMQDREMQVISPQQENACAQKIAR